MLLGNKIIVVLPAYNAARTLERTYREIPVDLVDEVVLVDDRSADDTLALAKELGIEHLVEHDANRGYGAVPYNNRTGGSSVKVTGSPGSPCNPAGATSPANTNYYPAFSPDDRYLTFTHVTGGQTAYSNNQAEIFVVDAAGATPPMRFGANDPPACQTSQHSPGVTNDWSKWAPEAPSAANGTTYYWVTFSSIRNGRPQLFVAPMTVKAGAVDVSYPALYLWNQPSTDDNHTPSWDDYQIPPIIID